VKSYGSYISLCLFLFFIVPLLLTACGGDDFESSPEDVEDAMVASFGGDSDAIEALMCEDEGAAFSAMQLHP
jgi:hypothetical protein